MKKMLFLLLAGILAKAELVYQGANPLDVTSYNLIMQPVIPLTFKNTGETTTSFSGNITGQDLLDFKISTNRCNNVAKNKSCLITIISVSKKIQLGIKSISIGGVDLNITVTKLNSQNQPIVIEPPLENFEFEQESLNDIQFVPGEKYKLISLLIKNTGNISAQPSFDWLSNSANISIRLNRCLISLKKDQNCLISLKVPAPAVGSTISQTYQISSSSQIRDSLSFVIKGVLDGGSSNLECNFNGNTVLHGSSVTAYQEASVSFGSTCSSQSRTCNNGVLSGSYFNTSCLVQEGASCSYNSITYNHGANVPGYSSSSVAFNQSCLSVAVNGTCNNGVIPNQPNYSTCNVRTKLPDWFVLYKDEDYPSFYNPTTTLINESQLLEINTSLSETIYSSPNHGVLSGVSANQSAVNAPTNSVSYIQEPSAQVSKMRKSSVGHEYIHHPVGLVGSFLDKFSFFFDEFFLHEEGYDILLKKYSLTIFLDASFEQFRKVADFNGELYFTAINNNDFSENLYKYDPLSGIIYKLVIEGAAGYFGVINNNLYLTFNFGTGRKIFKIVGNQLIQVSNINPSGSDAPGPILLSNNGNNYWVGSNNIGQLKLFKINDFDMIEQVSNLNSAGNDFNYSTPTFFKVNNELFFSAINQNQYSKLFKMDSSEVISQISNINSAGNDYISDISAFNNQIYFCGKSSTTGLFKVELNGSISLVLNIPDYGNYLSLFNNELYFKGLDSNNFQKLFKVDSLGNVQKIADINQGTDDFFSNQDAVASVTNNQLLFEVNGQRRFKVSLSGIVSEISSNSIFSWDEFDFNGIKFISGLFMNTASSFFEDSNGNVSEIDSDCDFLFKFGNELFYDCNFGSIRILKEY